MRPNALSLKFILHMEFSSFRLDKTLIAISSDFLKFPNL